MSDLDAFVPEWRDCPYCKKRKWCSEKALFEHIEGCDERPTQRFRKANCPKCGSAIQKTAMISPLHKGVVYICLNSDCDYQLEVIEGGKHG